MNNDFGKPINFISILLYKNNYLQHLYQLMNINTYCLNHRRSQEFVLEAALFRGGGTPDPWMATVSITSRLLGRKIEIWRNFWLKMYFWASWEGLSPPSAPCWLRLWPEYMSNIPILHSAYTCNDSSLILQSYWLRASSAGYMEMYKYKCSFSSSKWATFSAAFWGKNSLEKSNEKSSHREEL